MKLAGPFDAFYDAISLGEEPTDRIESAVGALTDYLREAYGLDASQVFPQGSWPSGTAVEPADREKGAYDVDLVAVCAADDATPEEALDDLEETLADNGTYKDRIDRDESRPCIRLRYADVEIGGFHVDVVPARESDGEAPLEIPRPDEGWRETAPKEYTEWCRDQGERFARTVKMLKRWRDVNQTARASVKSIVLQVLVAKHLPAVTSDAEAILETLEGIDAFLADYPDGPPELPNPILETENLAARWATSAHKDFRKTVAEAAELARSALDESDEAKSHELWRELLGEDFPPPPRRGWLTPPPYPAPGTRKKPQEAPGRVEWA